MMMIVVLWLPQIFIMLDSIEYGLVLVPQYIQHQSGDVMGT